MFGARLRTLRKERKITMKELGKKLSLAESTISGYENGTRKPDLDTLDKIADFFDVSVDFLLDRTNIRNPLDLDDEEQFIKWAKDSTTGAFFSEILESEEAELEELREIWEIMKKRRKNK